MPNPQHTQHDHITDSLSETRTLNTAFNSQFDAGRFNCTSRQAPCNITNFMELSPSWEAASSAATHRISQHFTEPEGSLSCSQAPSTGPYPDPDQSSPNRPILSLSKIHFDIVMDLLKLVSEVPINTTTRSRTRYFRHAYPTTRDNIILPPTFRSS
jgi:hypothetical protein